MPLRDDPFKAIIGQPLMPEPIPLPEPLWAPREPPRPSALPETEIERAACGTLGVPHPSDVEEGRITDPHHYLGTFRIGESEAAVSAATDAYARLTNGDAGAPTITTFAQHRRLYRGDEAELPRYLEHLAHAAPALARLIDRELPLHAPEEPRRRHTYVLGTTRSGKSELLKTLIHSYAARPNLAAVIALDPAGEFVEQVARWPEFVGNDRLVFVRHGLAPGMTPTINPLEIPDIDPLSVSDQTVRIKRVVAQQMLGAFEEIIAGGAGSNVTLPMRALLMPCILTLFDRPGSTLRDLQRFMDDKRNDDLVALGATRTHHEDAAAFFATGQFGEERYKGTKGSIYSKLQDLFSTGPFAELTCGRTTINLRQEIDEGKVILFDLSKGRIGANESVAFGRLLVAMLQGIALRREEIKDPAHRTPTHVVIDECHNFITPSIETILLEAGKYRMFLTLCQQNVGHGMGVETRRVVTGMTHVKLVGLTDPDQWERTARLLPIDAGRLRELGTGRFFARFGINAPVFKFKARGDLLGGSRSMLPETWERVVQRQLDGYYRPVKEPAHTVATGPGGFPPGGDRNLPPVPAYDDD